MATSDGIEGDDWEILADLAGAVASQSGSGCDASLERKRLLRALDKLEKKYGRLPSILSTRADYVDDPELSLSLLKEAYVTADERSDVKNKAFISSTLSELYLETFQRKDLARFWLKLFKKDLGSYSEDEYLQKLCAELSESLSEA
ncbi:hypothetical protein [Pseudomonas nitroreducens]|uniref:hypothetical protein n=1 Tax=Pseudomonas nitroreducens TaxID=46680 RepID=UPI00209C94A2|nr:hypothetical protein [Pseudomonas nitroreducens]MCP1625410.1 hypothetical protein [Pseudomonas nitroreducens]